MTSPQAPIQSGFGAQTSASEALGARDLHGVVAIVTGGYSGIGLSTTRVLAAAGATVIVPARTPDKARDAVRGIAGVELEALDLAQPSSVDAFAARFVASNRPLHVLINNAGIMACPLTRDARGFEAQLATNHLGHFQLTARLWPALRQARGARVVSVSSLGHRFSAMHFEDPHFQHRAYDKWQAYGQAKTANALFALALDARGEAEGVRAFSVHPGTILTDLVRHFSEQERQAVEERAAQFKTVEQGAATQIWCAVSAQLDGMGGVYCEDVDVARPVPADVNNVLAPTAGALPPQSNFGVRPWAMDPGQAEQLWKLSETWTGVAFGG